jgi:hypothetical protein
MLRRNNMQILPGEIDTVEEVGELDGNKVKMVKTRGGFYFAIGRPKGKLTEESLGAGSHPAIVKFNLERQHPGYRPLMQKSESMLSEPVVDKHSHFLSDDLRKSGHDIYSVQSGDKVEFQITKDNEKISSVNSTIDKGVMLIEDMKINKEFTRAMAGAASEKALDCSVKKVRIQGK